MSEYISRGKSLVSQGERKLSSFGWFSNKYEEAADLFEKAANQFKLAKSCECIAACLLLRNLHPATSKLVVEKPCSPKLHRHPSLSQGTTLARPTLSLPRSTSNWKANMTAPLPTSRLQKLFKKRMHDVQYSASKKLSLYTQTWGG